jgi:uncharacterized protein involved in exopolysaccharide biosynthesis
MQMPNTREDNSLSFIELWDIVRRRMFYFVLPVVAIILFASVYVLKLPNVYRSQATILIEDPEIPKELVGAAVTNYASQQIQLISQRLLTVKNIQEVVERHGVYEHIEDGPSARAQANRFREDMQLELISAEIFDPRGRPAEAAVAFLLAFRSESPEIAQAVTGELVNLFLNENIRSSASRASGMADTLRAAVEEANGNLIKAESELAVFKANNSGALPELQQLNLNVINRSQQQLSDTEARLQALQQRRIELSAQLAPISPHASVTLPTGETIMSDRERLRVLLMDYQRKIAIYEAGHPDLVRLKREIDTLRKTVGTEGASDMLWEQLRLERERLSGMREKYSNDHPDIRQAEATIRELEAQLAQNPSRLSEPVVADNPAYVLLNTQLQSTDLEIRSLLQKRQELQATIARHEALLKQLPQIEMQYDALLRAHENAEAKYLDLQAKLRAAEVAANVDQKISGQRFTVIEPPALPNSPESPNRTALMVMVVIFAVGIGTGFVTFIELTDSTIRSAGKLAELAGAEPLAVIPYLENSADIARTRVRAVMLASAVLAVGAVYVWYIYRLI